jgi:hypothetical protein
MEKLKRILICPYFGDLPAWWDEFHWPVGYGIILDRDLEGFKKRVKRVLDIDYPGEYGSGKVWDYRCALGLLYEKEIKDFDFWGTTDLDVVFGDVNKFFPDEQLNELDIWSNHGTYVCGFWTLYRNDPIVNRLFSHATKWKDYLISSEPNGWVETTYSRLVEGSGLMYKYSGDLQGDPYRPPFNLKKENGKLFQDGNEIAMLHFRRDKKWPL